MKTSGTREGSSWRGADGRWRGTEARVFRQSADEGQQVMARKETAQTERRVASSDLARRDARREGAAALLTFEFHREITSSSPSCRKKQRSPKSQRPSLSSFRQRGVSRGLQCWDASRSCRNAHPSPQSHRPVLSRFMQAAAQDPSQRERSSGTVGGSGLTSADLAPATVEKSQASFFFGPVAPDRRWRACPRSLERTPALPARLLLPSLHQRRSAKAVRFVFLLASLLQIERWARGSVTCVGRRGDGALRRARARRGLPGPHSSAASRGTFC